VFGLWFSGDCPGNAAASNPMELSVTNSRLDVGIFPLLRCAL
jgi:hypothetical protein